MITDKILLEHGYREWYKKKVKKNNEMAKKVQ